MGELPAQSYSEAEARFSAALLDLWGEADALGGLVGDDLAAMAKRALADANLPWVSIRAGERRPSALR